MNVGKTGFSLGDDNIVFESLGIYLNINPDDVYNTLLEYFNMKFSGSNIKVISFNNKSVKVESNKNDLFIFYDDIYPYIINNKRKKILEEILNDN